MSKGNEPAYPRDCGWIQHPQAGKAWYGGAGGLTKRELFAAMALAAMELPHHGEFSKLDLENGPAQRAAMWRARAAVRYADALLTVLEAQ